MGLSIKSLNSVAASRHCVIDWKSYSFAIILKDEDKATVTEEEDQHMDIDHTAAQAMESLNLKTQEGQSNRAPKKLKKKKKKKK